MALSQTSFCATLRCGKVRCGDARGRLSSSSKREKAASVVRTRSQKGIKNDNKRREQRKKINLFKRRGPSPANASEPALRAEQTLPRYAACR
ncbi:hypothetical protein SKAU_G00103520 [Synaphobranchus kaupii]|uniref:Uncharacterized protein n=1 Tax=Synaphobranchus kaupii TaxID=118154 RepID=A0A9Q1J7C6_SYNKA|nr:hypothetical protein SKAU_G00103520 [Synaphobranchus kaupii]